jgi:hypothetical protein
MNRSVTESAYHGYGPPPAPPRAGLWARLWRLIVWR